MKITKAALIEGKKFLHEVSLSEKHTVEVRSLTEGELNKLTTKRAKLFKVDMKQKGKSRKAEIDQIDFDAVSLMENEKETILQICACGLSTDDADEEKKWTPEEVENLLPAGLPIVLAEKILEITEVEGGDLSSFRQYYAGSRIGINVESRDEIDRHDTGNDSTSV